MESAWREHPKLKGRFHPEFPDDLQVVVHDSGPGGLRRELELVWVRVTACEADVFCGVVLNQPNQLQDVSQGSQIIFLVPEVGAHPFQVTRKYLEERSNWRLLSPCKTCGMTELVDPPSELLAFSFPSVSAENLSRGFTFTARCRFCGGAMVVRLKRNTWPWSNSK